LLQKVLGLSYDLAVIVFWITWSKKTGISTQQSISPNSKLVARKMKTKMKYNKRSFHEKTGRLAIIWVARHKKTALTDGSCGGPHTLPNIAKGQKKLRIQY